MLHSQYLYKKILGNVCHRLLRISACQSHSFDTRLSPYTTSASESHIYEKRRHVQRAQVPLLSRCYSSQGDKVILPKSFYQRRVFRPMRKRTPPPGVIVKLEESTSLAVEMYYDEAGNGNDENKIAPSEQDYVNFNELQDAYKTSMDVGELGMTEANTDEALDGSDSDNEDNQLDVFGGPDPASPISEVPCPGCGAFLHCQNPAIVGYMPSQRYDLVDKKDLRKTFCQRCVMMRKYNIALNASVSPEEYAQVISVIRERSKEARLAVVVVDIMDMSNSIIPQLSNLIGRHRPLVIVGNKVDLLPRDDLGYLERVKSALIRTCRNADLGTEDSIKHLALVSAKTGYGIEDLVGKLITDWQGSVYIIGSTNCGKSTLFNRLLSSDYCKSSARDFIKRATTCVWPGTTLNLLRFPILYPARWRIVQRDQRLTKQRSEDAERQLMKEAADKDSGNRSLANLMGHVGATFQTVDSIAIALDDATDDPATYSFGRDQFNESGRTYHNVAEPDLEEERYKQSHWCYDSPGLVNKEQVINQLTQAELSLLMSRSAKGHGPQTFLMFPGDSLFVSGLARIDYVRGDVRAWVTVVANVNLPIFISPHKEADEFYEKHIGTARLGLPIGDSSRLSKLAPLEGPEVVIEGQGNEYCVGDLVFSSIGWAALATERGKISSFAVRTPGGAGALYRTPALLPYAVNSKGKRIRGTAFFHNNGHAIKDLEKPKGQKLVKRNIPDHLKYA